MWKRTLRNKAGDPPLALQGPTISRHRAGDHLPLPPGLPAWSFVCDGTSISEREHPLASDHLRRAPLHLLETHAAARLALQVVEQRCQRREQFRALLGIRAVVGFLGVGGRIEVLLQVGRLLPDAMTHIALIAITPVPGLVNRPAFGSAGAVVPLEQPFCDHALLVELPHGVVHRLPVDIGCARAVAVFYVVGQAAGRCERAAAFERTGDLAGAVGAGVEVLSGALLVMTCRENASACTILRLFSFSKKRSQGAQ